MTVTAEGMRSYQSGMVELMLKDSWKRLLVLRYGTGKSWTMLRALYVCMLRQAATSKSKLSVTGTIIFCRNRNIGTWKDEITKRSPGTVAVSIHELNTTLIAALKTDWVVLVPHHLMAIERHYDLIQELIENTKPCCMVVDESTKIKNPTTKRAQAIIKLAEIHAKANPRGERFCMTGQSTPEGPYEIWSQIQFCHPFSNKLGDSYYRMLQNYFLRSDRGYALKYDKREQFYAICKMYIARMSHEMWVEYNKNNKLTVTYTIERYEECDQQKKLLDDLEKNWALSHDLGTDEYSYTIQLHTKAHQISNGFFYTQNKEVQYLEDGVNPKVDLLMEILEDLFEESKGQKQVIIWCHFAPDYAMVSNELDRLKIRFAVGPHEDALKRFEKGDARVILMPITVSEGFNELAVADTAIFFSNVYSIETRNQAEHRMIRLNQKSPVVTFVDICGNRSYDKQVIESLQTKQPIKVH